MGLRTPASSPESLPCPRYAVTITHVFAEPCLGACRRWRGGNSGPSRRAIPLLVPTLDGESVSSVVILTLATGSRGGMPIENEPPRSFSPRHLRWLESYWL